MFRKNLTKWKLVFAMSQLNSITSSKLLFLPPNTLLSLGDEDRNINVWMLSSRDIAKTRFHIVRFFKLLELIWLIWVLSFKLSNIVKIDVDLAMCNVSPKFNYLIFCVWKKMISVIHPLVIKNGKRRRKTTQWYL